MANLSSKVADVKVWGRGFNAYGHRSPSCAGKQLARRAFNKAARKASRIECRDAACFVEPEPFAPMGEDHDSHVDAFETAGGYFATFDDCRCEMCRYAETSYEAYLDAYELDQRDDWRDYFDADGGDEADVLAEMAAE